MKKIIITIIILIALALVFYVFYKKEAKAPAADTNFPATGQSQPKTQTASPQTQTNVKGNTGADYTPPQAQGGGENAGSNIQVSEVDFDGTAYSPKVSNIKAGDYIFFKNTSTVNFWPVAGSAATLAAYPSFNPKNPLAPGGEYKFQFTKAGSWSFGDNLHANLVFGVNVSQ